MKIILAVLIGFYIFTMEGISQESAYTCSGYVYDSVGMVPLANVNIFVAGSKIGTTTNHDGFFKIKLSSQRAVLYVSFMGYGIRQITIDSTTSMPLKISLVTEIKEIGEVTVFNDKFRNILEGDSLQVLDYEIWNDRLLILARSANDSLRQRIYLTSLNGFIYSYRDLRDIGKKLKFPDEPAPRKVYLFKDTYGEIQLLGKTRVWQIFLRDNKIFLMYPTKYEVCAKYLFPIKCRLNNNLYFQDSDEYNCNIYFAIRGTDSIRKLKTIHDEFGKTRYFRNREVVVPMITMNQQVVVFNFFKNELEFFNERGRSVRTIPTMFHTRWYLNRLGEKAYTLDNINFTQKIIQDQVSNKVYSIWRTVLSGRYKLKELNMETGEISREYEFPDHQFIEKILVNDNRAYFMYRDKSEQRFKSLFTMSLN